MTDYHQSSMDKNIVFYTIKLVKLRTNEKLVLEKRFSEFDKLNQTLSKIFPNLPSMPSKTIFKVTEPEVLEQRRQTLDNYLKVLFFYLLTKEESANRKNGKSI